ASWSNRRRISPGAGRWQVFGLASVPALGRLPNVHRFPVANDQCVLVDFVLAYRCGAAPDSHRVPSSLETISQAPARDATYCTVSSQVNNILGQSGAAAPTYGLLARAP